MEKVAMNRHELMALVDEHARFKNALEKIIEAKDIKDLTSAYKYLDPGKAYILATKALSVAN